MSSEVMLAVESLSAWYGAARILYDLNFTVRRGEVVALMGRNGAGKSTTIKAIMGLVAQRRGKVRFNSEDISRLRSYEIARRGLGYVPEDRRIFVDLTVMENLDVGRQPARHFAGGRRAPSWTPEKLFTLFPNLAEMPHRLGGRMSGGEQQMLTVAFRPGLHAREGPVALDRKHAAVVRQSGRATSPFGVIAKNVHRAFKRQTLGFPDNEP
ncbi:MAG: ATP-binding cassette domain-containing protein [Pseudolabrys sp.]